MRFAVMSFQSIWTIATSAWTDTAPSGLAKPVMAKVRRGNILFLTKRAIKVCTAASLTVVIWYSGLFGDSLAVRNEKIPDQARRGNSFSQMVSGVSDSIGNWIRGFGIYSRGE